MNMKPQRAERIMLIVAVLIFLFFLVLSLLFVFSLRQQNELQSMEHLVDAVAQETSGVRQQIESDFQVLRGVSVSLSELGVEDEEKIRNILRAINDSNTFERMGFADTEGQVDLVDLDGSVYENVDLSQKNFFRRALAGKEAMSQTYFEALTQEYVNYYAVPVTGENGALLGVLCAVNSGDIFREILNIPIIRGKGLFALINREGQVVGPSFERDGMAVTNEALILDANLFSQEQQTAIRSLLSNNTAGTFDFAFSGERWMGSLQPVGVNDWFVLGMVSYRALDQYYNQAAFGTTVIIVAACCIFVFFVYRQRTLLLNNRKSLEYLAYTDLLTGARNYEKFQTDAAAFMEAHAGSPMAVWSMDIKQFKVINDIFGSSVGDQVIRHMADMLAAEDNGGIFGRVSADQFAGIRTYETKADLQRWFDQLYELFSGGGIVPTKRMHIDMSAGIYCMDDFADVPNVNEMVNSAAIAKSYAKQEEGTHLVFFTAEIRDVVRKETELAAAGRAALENGEFTFYLQPKVSIQGPFRIVGAEALVRWQSPAGLIPPGEFIPLFERTGMIVDLDRYVFEQACIWYRRYLDAGHRPINLAVNISRLGLMREDYVEYYSTIKRRHRIPDGVLELELTESVIFDDYPLFRSVVSQLQSAGFICSIDDFGSGYSSLNVIKNLPIDVVKLDAMFFREGYDLQRERIVISNFIRMAKELRIKTIAEGIEQADQLAFLQQIGCDVVQGYIFSRPVPRDVFVTLMAENDGLLTPNA